MKLGWVMSKFGAALARVKRLISEIRLLMEPVFRLVIRFDFFGVFRIDSKYMKTKEIVKSIIKERLLSNRAKASVAKILKLTSHDEICNALDHLGEYCYRDEPNHDRYDADRWNFPIVSQSEFSEFQRLKNISDMDDAGPWFTILPEKVHSA